MSAPKTTITEIDKTTRVPQFPGVYGAIAIPAKRGPLEPTLVTSESQFLSLYTPNSKVDVGFDNSYFSALAFLAKSNKLWVVRPDTSALYGGLVVKKQGSAEFTQAVAAGISDPLDYTFGADDCILITGADPGDWNDKIGVKIKTDKGLAKTAEVFTADPVLDKLTVASFWPTGYKVRVINSGGGLPGGLLSTTDYYVINNGGTAIRLATSLANAQAGIAIDITSAGTGIHTIYSSDFVINLDADLNQVTTQIEWETGYPVLLHTTGDLTGTGLSANTTYYVINIDATHIKLATTLANALSGISVDITGVGTGVMTLYAYTSYVRESGAFLLEVYKDNGSAKELVESFICSRVPGMKDGFGANIFIEDVLQSSNYIRAYSNNEILPSILPKANFTTVYMAGGDDGSTVTDGMMITAIEQLNNSGAYPVTLLMDGGWATPNYQLKLLEIAESRQDCFAVLSIPYDKEASASYVNDIVDYRTNVLNANSSYGALYTPHVKIYDKFNDRSIFVPPDGYAAAQISETAARRAIWYPVGGFERGKILVNDTRRRFSSGEMDYLYLKGINPIKFEPGKGIYLNGQKTLLSRPSDLERMNVRLMLIVVEPAIKEALDYFLFEINNVATRSTVKVMIDTYMETIKAGDGVYDFYTVCNDENNTPADIDNHILNVDLFIKPTKAVEYIKTNVILTPTGMDFKFAAQ